MSSDTATTDRERPAGAASPPAEEPDRAALVAELERLRAEADRLRESYVRARRSRYRRSAVGFALLGLLATAGGVAVPGSRTVLFALGGTGLFAALLTWFVTPERFVSAGVGDAVFEALAGNHERLCRELGLSDERVYVPAADETTGVWLYVPQRSTGTVPDADALASLFVVGDDESTRGVSLRPTGETLFREFEAALSGPLAGEPAELVAQVREAIVEQFEVADGLRTDLDADGGRLTVAVDGGPYGEITRFDHPVVSVVAVALARGLDRSVRVELAGENDEAVATLRWDDADAVTDSGEAQEGSGSGSP